jgi:hypothetical protein
MTRSRRARRSSRMMLAAILRIIHAGQLDTRMCDELERWSVS